jgi:hypothetical protein
MRAEDLVNEYAELYGKGMQKRIDADQYNHMKEWMERTMRKRMNRPFFITRGSGGGQKYRLWWLIFDILGNANTPSYFYTDMSSTSKYLKEHGHKDLQSWINDDSEHLKY